MAQRASALPQTTQFMRGCTWTFTSFLSPNAELSSATELLLQALFLLLPTLGLFPLIVEIEHVFLSEVFIFLI